MRDILENVWNRYRKAGEILKLEDYLMEELTSFKMRLSFDMKAVVCGQPKRLKAVRVWHRAQMTRYPFKGGNRFRTGLTLGSLESHAAEMSIKCFLHGLPYGGAKGGINVNTHPCSSEELRQLVFTFVDELHQRNAIGPFLDIPAPDLGTNSTIMYWMMDRYSFLERGKPYVEGVVTGKPIEVGGVPVGGLHGRREATGYGLYLALDALRKDLKLSEKPSVAIQGFGNVGTYIALYFFKNGYKIVAVADEFGGALSESGLNIPKLIEYASAKKPRTVSGFPGSTAISAKELIGFKCNILVPAAVEEVITAENATAVKAKVILEGANGPTTPEADDILEDKGVVVIPDIYANSGRVAVSFFEWGRNTDNMADPRIPRENDIDLVLNSLDRMMRRVGNEIVEYSKRYKVSLRLAAYILALDRASGLLRVRRNAGETVKTFG